MRVERTEGFVHQQHAGVHRERAGDLHALGHAAGQPPRIVGSGLVEADHPQRPGDPPVPLLARNAAFQPESGVTRHGPPRQQRIVVVLKHHHHSGRWAGNRFSIENDRPATRFDQTAEQAQQRGLADAGASDDADDLTGVHVQREVAQHDACPAGRGKSHVDPVDVVETHGPGHTSAVTSGSPLTEPAALAIVT